MLKAGKIYNNHILDSQDKRTDYDIVGNQICLRGNPTGFYLEGNNIRTGSGTTGFYIQDGKILGPSSEFPWT